MAVTLKDISKLTGINAGTISHVLNNHPKAQAVREDTRKRIFAVADKLGYRKNELAATTRTGINRTIALIGDFDLDRPTFFINTVMSGVLTAATKNDYGVRVYSPAQLDACMNEILSYRMKYVIVESLNLECRSRMADFCDKNDLQLVYIFEQSCNGLPTVASADREGIKNAVEHLVKQGHRRISLICAEHNYHYMDERHQGYLEGLAGAGIPVNEHLIACHREMNESRIAIESMLKLPVEQRPTAFICISDSLGLQVEGLAMQNGLSVPEDISVIGFGNADFCVSTIPPLTSVAQPFEEMGKIALELVIGLDCGIKPNSKNEYLLPTELIIRESMIPC
jgi:LacI family transcriptional regulator